jgi:hypothetical protein
MTDPRACVRSSSQVHPFRVAMEHECIFAEKLWFGGKSDATRTAKLLRSQPK